MAVEIERKYLVNDDDWRIGASGVEMIQGYLTVDPERTVRVRLAGEQGFLTIKGRTHGISRLEFEYAIPASEARELLELCLLNVIQKTRYRIDHAGYTWEVDVFHGQNRGLVLAEVELTDAAERPEIPAWVGAEVSHDRRYSNSHLAREPFCNWPSA